MPTYRRLAVAKAKTQAGVKESPPGSNRGPMVDKYQEADSLHAPEHGYSWCASFQNWIFREVGRPLVELNLSASVGNMLSAARGKGWVNNSPDVGDIVCFDWDSLTGPGKGDWPDHVGIVASVGTNGNFQSWEGNTAVGNDSNGGEVMLRSRNVSMVEGFIRVPGGYKMETTWRFIKNGKAVRDYHSRIKAMARFRVASKVLDRGDTIALRKVQARVQMPNA